VLELLRLGSYQLLYMDGVPAYAAVSETVEQVRSRVGHRPAGFANAVLRKVQTCGDGPERFPAPDEDPAGFSSTWGSHPEWLVRRWLARWSVAEVRALVEADNRRPSAYLVPLGVDSGEAVERLAAFGIESTEVGRGTGCVQLGGGSAVSKALEAIPDSIVQDPAANLVSRYTDVPPGTMIADFCAAPGGKVLALSCRTSKILASDRSQSRIRMVRDNARRTGRSMALMVADALHPAIARADAVLLDVPCSGTGTLSRHPDARWRLRPESIVDLAGLQGRMLEAAADVVVPGGLLVYSTCTLEAEENEERVEAFLRARPDFALEPTDAVPPEYRDAAGHLFVTPWRSGFDGAFAARMRRAA
jgi:16S rRNA (cytosine967-C5)-methyltransferase